MFLGAAGVGKTSLKRALMKQPWDVGANSTIIADVRQVKYEWMGGGQQWIEMMHEDEIDELAKLLAAVDNSSDARTLLCSTLNSSTTHSPSMDPDRLSLCNVMCQDFERTAVNPTISEAILRSEKISLPVDIANLTVQPFLHVWDCGGQPVFLETLPAFITSRTMFILVFDASKDFNSNWKSVQYQQGMEVTGEEMNITVLDLLLQWMINIHAHLAKRDEQGALLDYPRILVIGTHGDQLTADDKLSKRNQFLSHCKGKACMELLQDFLIVDNTLARKSDEEGEDPNFAKIREAINEFTTKKLAIQTHVSWILFRKVVQGLGRNVISLEEAHAIAVACKISSANVQNVLNFYHELGVILYYPFIMGLENHVILNPKWFLATLGKILTLEGREEYKTDHMWSVLREYGVLVQPLYIGAWKNCEGVDPEAVMDLLVHLRLAAPVKTKVYYDYDVKQYFIPAVLPFSRNLASAPISGFEERATTLHIIFSTKFVPPGFFTRFAAALLESSMCKILFKKGVYRNRLTFRYGEPPLDHVILTDLSNVVEVVVLRFVPESAIIAPLDVVCGKLLEFLKKCCEEVNEIVCSRRIPYELKFVCDSVECRQLNQELHYLVHPSNGQTKDLHLHCEKNDQFRLPVLAESYWFSSPTKPENETMTDREIYKLSCKIGVDKVSELAAVLNMMQTLEKINRDSTQQKNPTLYLLFQWRKEVGYRADLAQALEEIGLSRVAEMLISGNIGNESRLSLTRSSGTHKIMPTHSCDQSPVLATPTVEEKWDLTISPTEADLAKASHYINDIAALAGALSHNDASLRLLKKEYSKKSSQALQLLKKWKEANSTASRQQLQELLLGLHMPEAARSLSHPPSYNIDSAKPPSGSCIIL